LTYFTTPKRALSFIMIKALALLLALSAPSQALQKPRNHRGLQVRGGGDTLTNVRFPRLNRFDFFDRARGRRGGPAKYGLV
jgi:hypothetical protein